MADLALKMLQGQIQGLLGGARSVLLLIDSSKAQKCLSPEFVRECRKLGEALAQAQEDIEEKLRGHTGGDEAEAEGGGGDSSGGRKRVVLS